MMENKPTIRSDNEAVRKPVDDTAKARILVVEDNIEFVELLKQFLQDLPVQVHAVFDGTSAINQINRQRFDVLLLDLQLPRVNGLEVLRHAKEQLPTSEVIVLTALHDIKMAVTAMKAGAYDYLTKPIERDELLLVVQRALERKACRLAAGLTKRKKELGEEDAFVGKSGVWLDLLEKAARYAVTDSLVFLEGETGSGKEVLAKYIHLQSHRRDRPFVVVDCGVIPDSLIESELFGFAKGAFTGAVSAKEGLVELAHTGTLFLDEIGDIDVKFQQKLLKFVETKSFRRVGDTCVRSVDVRIITATNKNLAQEAEAGRFRSDLWYRLNVLKLNLPPLRERREDILPLAEYFLKRFSPAHRPKQFTPEAIAALQAYAWPGNVRELQSIIQRAVTVSDDEWLTVEDLTLESPITVTLPAGEIAQKELCSLREAERNHITFVLSAVGWNISRAAKILQIGRNTLYVKMREYGIDQPK